MSQLCPLLFLGLVPPVVSLFCFTCVFPTGLYKVPSTVSSRSDLSVQHSSRGKHGDFSVIYCTIRAVSSILCVARLVSTPLDLNFTFTNECCTTYLCNGAAVLSALYWTGSAFSILLSLTLSLS
ncbi:hypothetical protein DPEC_G00351470 [Dallia pectoralis]|uniref:Uncharacterized protein n=1 Tax=Dallia pectoralis TaxID=75939 RepID=A0ACC2F208_DALPE|nr:hypothetical protein DPEC_G00351470 [Dallia pectoralis]